MRRWNRALTTLVAVAAAGALLWFVPHYDRWSNGGYWGVMGLMAFAGLLLGLSQLHARDGNPRASFLLVFVPVLVTAGLVILAAQPEGNWIRDHVLEWSGDVGIAHAVHNLGEHVAVLAFGLGLVFGLTFEPAMLRRSPVARDGPATTTGDVATDVEAPAGDEPEPAPEQTAVVEREPAAPR